MELRFTVEGLPSTDHRPRIGKTWRGKTNARRSPEYDAWKRRVRMAALAARPPGWRLDLRYAVECVGYMPSNAYDADNLRCLGDAAQGVLWVSDTRVRPITYDYEVDKIRPRLEVEIVAYDPKTTRARRWVEIEAIGGAG